MSDEFPVYYKIDGLVNFSFADFNFVNSVLKINSAEEQTKFDEEFAYLEQINPTYASKIRSLTLTEFMEMLEKQSPRASKITTAAQKQRMYRRLASALAESQKDVEE